MNDENLIRVELAEFSCYDRPIDELISLLQAHKAEYEKEGLTKLTVRIGSDYDENVLLIIGYRPENEKERKARLKEDERIQKLREKQERKLYADLKKKYGKD